MSNSRATEAAKGSATESVTPSAKRSTGARVSICLGTVQMKFKSKAGGTEIGDKAVICWVDPEVAQVLNFRAPTAEEEGNVLPATTAGGVKRGKNRGCVHGRTIMIQRPPAEGAPAGKPRFVQFQVPHNIRVATLAVLLGKYVPATVKSGRVKGGYRFSIPRDAPIPQTD